MKENSIWNSLKFDKNSPNILWELKRQAELLADKSDGVLYAEVNPIDAYHEKTFEPGIIYNFHVCAPYLGNLRTLLFTVAETGNKIVLLNRISGEKEELNTLLELVKKLEKLIASDEIQKTLSNLFSSSLEIKSVNQKQIKPGEEWAKIIERDFFVTHHSTKVTLKNGMVYDGYFQTFDDWIELKNKLKFRFVEWKNAMKLREEYSTANKLNKDYSTIIACADIENIELTSPPVS